MLSFSPEKLFIVGLIALIVLGPNRLPEAARTAGRFFATVRRMSSGFQAEVRDALAEPTSAFHSAMGEFRPTDIRRSVRDTITSTLNPPLPPAGGPPATSDGTKPSGTPSLPAPPDDPSLN